MYTHILIPTDGSELAQKGVDHALSLAKALGSSVTIMTATESFPIMYDEGWEPDADAYRAFDEDSRKSAMELLARAKTQAEKMGVSASIEHAPNTNAASAILEASERLGCNLVVMSSHGRRGIVRMFLGSQTSEVLAHSQIPVLVVR